MITHRFAVALGFIVVAATSSPSVLSARDLSFEDRVAAQKAIEQVYWNHRIWPKANPQPKPPMTMAMSEDVIRARVEDYIEKSQALETWWHRPITGEQLQAEMNRMAHDSQDPQVLREIFAALADDPFVIAETLARQTLADRLIRSWYASDARFHADVRARAVTALESIASVDRMKSLGGDYRQTTLQLPHVGGDGEEARAGSDVVRLRPEEWKEQLAGLASRFSTDVESIPSGRLSRLEETADSFVVSAVLARQPNTITIASVSWPKRSFDNWWSGQRQSGSRLIGATASFVPAAIAATGCTSDAWAATAAGVADKRRGHTAVWTGAEMIVWGGETAGGYVVTGGRYNPSTDAWIPTSTVDAPSVGRVGHSAVWTGTEMIIWGGSRQGASDTELNDGARYNPATDIWTKDTTANPVHPRAFHTAVWTGTEMIVWGGEYFDSFGTHALNSGGRYNPLGDYYTAWTSTSTGADVPAPRYSHSAVWTGTQMIVWGGGYDGTSNNALNTGGRYDPASDSWTSTLTTNIPTERYLHSAVWTGTKMLIWGGVKATIPTNSGGLYDPTTDQWVSTSTGTNVPAPRFGHSAVWTGTEMIVWGGGTSGTDTGGRYDPATSTWTSTSVGANVPVARSGFTTVWTGSEMIVWGGYVSGVGYVNSGGRYDPSTDGWVPTSTSPTLPSARSADSAIWTGVEMIIWGGMTDTTAVNTGGRYNPSLDAWSATSLGANVPSARSSHTAVWTGTEMIVWGGFSPASSSLGSGGRYNPSTNTWTTTSGGPVARRGHSAVWTGTEMIVWGGQDSTTLMNTGGRYDPSGDTWTTTSTVQAPFHRAGHTAVWTGSEMIVWGGEGCTGTPDCSLSDGSRYDPSTDAWTGITSGGIAPTPRTSHTAVWTGTEMIVWGGIYTSVPLSYYLNTGARFNPATGTWSPMSTGASVPTGRYAHSAVWTGAQMIVWGGSTANAYVNSGGRYNPVTDSWTATSTVSSPTARYGHTATWSGSEMIIWGGTPGSTSGGRYCGCLNARTVYRDADGDGYGDRTTSESSNCDGSAPAGYVDNGSDCNDGNASVFPNAPEVNDGVDNECEGDDGFGSIDEISSSSGFLTAGDKTRFSWASQNGATSYDVARSTTPDFSSGCRLLSSNDPFVEDTESPDSGVGFYYLVRSSAPHAGSWGQGSNGSPRGGVCLTP